MTLIELMVAGGFIFYAVLGGVLAWWFELAWYFVILAIPVGGVCGIFIGAAKHFLLTRLLDALERRSRDRLSNQADE